MSKEQRELFPGVFPKLREDLHEYRNLVLSSDKQKAMYDKYMAKYSPVKGRLMLQRMRDAETTTDIDELSHINYAYNYRYEELGHEFYVRTQWPMGLRPKTPEFLVPLF